MDLELHEDKPIFQQIAEKVEASILDGSIKEGDRIPSTNEFAKYYQINPATAGKGINQLVEQEIIYKKRGIGMFVADGAREIILQKRKDDFYEKFIIPLKKEATKIGLPRETLLALISKEDQE
ncbi:GntR family transcriptional regulator [Bacillus suaedae]|uniref:GntR family transcriptional regulator n=1 Tax=Halalkalibacter suaedae TaxID=2822140 RepID=A0A941AMS7_9BACI|nr:GntR family transcriptional regulator [Bacillus suaedae]MBP3949542.1 GntR family transcriptional regulator [Bacillus suaedae]